MNYPYAWKCAYSGLPYFTSWRLGWSRTTLVGCGETGVAHSPNGRSELDLLLRPIDGHLTPRIIGHTGRISTGFVRLHVFYLLRAIGDRQRYL